MKFTLERVIFFGIVVLMVTSLTGAIVLGSITIYPVLFPTRIENTVQLKPELRLTQDLIELLQNGPIREGCNFEGTSTEMSTSFPQEPKAVVAAITGWADDQGLRCGAAAIYLYPNSDQAKQMLTIIHNSISPVKITGGTISRTSISQCKGTGENSHCSTMVAEALTNGQLIIIVVNNTDTQIIQTEIDQYLGYLVNQLETIYLPFKPSSEA